LAVLLAAAFLLPQKNFTIQMVSTAALFVVALWEYVALRKATATTA